MTRKFRLYLESSFWDRLADTRRPHERQLSHRFLHRACPGHQILISGLVLEEVSRTPDPEDRRIIHRRLTGVRRKVLTAAGRAAEVAMDLKSHGKFGESMIADLTHLGYAINVQADAVVTWDENTMARDKVRLAVDAYCRRKGIKAPLIGTPPDIAEWLELRM